MDAFRRLVSNYFGLCLGLHHQSARIRHRVGCTFWGGSQHSGCSNGNIGVLGRQTCTEKSFADVGQLGETDGQIGRGGVSDECSILDRFVVVYDLDGVHLIPSNPFDRERQKEVQCLHGNGLPDE